MKPIGVILTPIQNIEINTKNARQPWDVIPPVCPGSFQGPLLQAQNTSPRRHPGHMAVTPQLAPIEEEQ